ncbi:MAG: Asp-tRNA(Asn)/Glu-tRNA(Gln) amidotransferase subunit GatA [Tissierellia bacterium]|nr:Asp-tRNA(Asn)/Glu-tRNA(Gln) amidotransferase subunit GatA [Tissierellia bacterium]
MDIKSLMEKFKNREISVEENTKNVLEKIKKNEFNHYITISEDAIERAKELDKKLEDNQQLGKLFGICVTLKDNISTKGLKTTCGSKMLENFEPVYNATVVENLLKEDAIIVAKTNMDEFAMGSSSETSYFGAVNNPLDTKRIPGGSSSGSAVSVAANDVLISLGTDTGGSVRQPASYCNIVGYYPTYSLISRYGVVSMANTLDQVALFANNVEDIIKTSQVVSSCDPKDMTSIKNEYEFSIENYDFNDKKIAVIKNLDIYDVEDVVKEDYYRAIEELKNFGCIIEEIEFKYVKYANAIYNVVMSSEASSNLSRFDGIRYGYQAENYDSIEDLFIKTRSEGFGEEVQRRIALGTMYLSASDGQKVYKQGLKLRKLLKDELRNLFNDFDLILTPTTTDLPYEIGSRNDDALSVYDSGIFNVIVNLATLCAISVPVRRGLSGSVQFIANAFDDNNLLNAARSFERSIR